MQQAMLRWTFFAALAAQLGCGPAWQPRQASFTVEGCPAVPAGAPEAWLWETDPEPVLSRGPAGAWDGVDVLNPSVVEVAGRFYNLYSGFDGSTWHTGLATSTDGRRWEKASDRPVLSPQSETWEGHRIAANGTAVHDGREFLYWYQAGEPARIGLARSADARGWRREGPPVLEPGPPGTWDEAGVADPYVIRCGATYYMYYLGQTRRGTIQRLGVARSSDGVHWQKHQSNPVLDLGPPGSFDERGLGEPAVFYTGSEFLMIYTGRDAGENRRLGAARSADGVLWKRAALAHPVAGGQAWNGRVVCDPALWAGKGKLWLWFGGGDVASPDENLHGQIGLANLDLR
jgi:predicted GH43/DUF377 family glycosyl hydrolase